MKQPAQTPWRGAQCSRIGCIGLRPALHIWIQHVSLNVLPCWFLVSGKLNAWLFNSLLIPGDQTKKINGFVGGIPTLRILHI